MSFAGNIISYDMQHMPSRERGGSGPHLRPRLFARWLSNQWRRMTHGISHCW